MQEHDLISPQSRIQDDKGNDGVDRRGFLECMAWVGTGVLWTVSGGILSSRRLTPALAAEPPSAGEFSFVQISDSHIGFAGAANQDVTATLQVALDKIKALQPLPAFLLHTGDLTHGQKPEQFDALAGKLQSAGVGEVFYVPGEHDVFADNGKEYLARHGKGTMGNGWRSFDYRGVHFVGLNNVSDLKAGGMGPSAPSNWSGSKRTWPGSRAAPRSSSSPTSHSGRIPPVGVGDRRRGASPQLPQALRVGDGAERAHPSNPAESRGQHQLPHGPVHRLPAAGAWRCTGAGADEGPR